MRLRSGRAKAPSGLGFFARRAWAALGAATALVCLPAAAHAGACGDLLQLKLPGAVITKATPITDGVYADDTAVGRAGRTYRDLPAFCRVHGVATPVPGSKIGFEIWLPDSWNGRLHMIGNGGYVSNISFAQMVQRLHAGDAAVATDTGHSGSDLTFGIGHPEAIVDFASRAVHESVAAAKLVTVAYYSKPARYAYFSGCSTGGYQGLMEAQRYPDDFDGIIAGAPGNNRTHLTMAFLWNYLANHRPQDDLHPILAVDDLKLITKAATAHCDALDGVVDGVINDPRKCDFKIETLRCRAGQQGGCLTGEQIDAARKIYTGPKDARTGKPLYPGYAFGSEGIMARANDPHPGWTGYWANTDKPGEPDRADFFRYWVFNDPGWSWWTFNWGSDIDTVNARMGAIFDATSTDLGRFSGKGGKLMMFMGWEDPVGAPAEAINYYDGVQARAKGDSPIARRAATQAFLRLYMIPGMDHCASGPGATNVSTATRDSTPPVSDEAHDMILALEAWVENSRAPGALIATHYKDEAGPPQVAFQRPLCVYPQVARYGGGPTDSASSFACVEDRPGGR